MIKPILITFVMVLIAFAGLLYGYKLGVEDSTALYCFTEMGKDYTHLKILKDSGARKLREFLETDIDLTIPLYKESIDNQSVLSKYLGPERDRITHHEHYLSYYQGIFEYKKQYPSKDKKLNVLIEMQDLINQIDAK